MSSNQNNIIGNLLLNFLRYFSTLLRNTLFLPYITLLVCYLFLLLIFLASIILNSEIGINFIDSIIKILFEWNILNEEMSNINKTYSPAQFSRLSTMIVIFFSIIFDLLSRIIKLVNKKITHFHLQTSILKLFSYFYIFTFILGSFIIFFQIKSLTAFFILLFLLIANIIFGFFALAVNNQFKKILKTIDKHLNN